MTLGPEDWYEGEIDPRVAELFGADPSRAVGEIAAAAEGDDELGAHLVEILEASLDTGADDTLGTAAVAIVLGEIRSREAVGALLRALGSPDEMVAAAAVRGLQRIGEAAFEPLAELLEGEDLDDDVAELAVAALEGVRGQDHPDLRAQVEARLIGELVAPRLGRRRRERAALALARLGVPRARGLVEQLLRTEFAAGNAYLEEALELIAEHPEGLPSPAEVSWQEELFWADAGVLPGGDLDRPKGKRTPLPRAPREVGDPDFDAEPPSPDRLKN
jgi:HEAT repeat protein